MSRHSFAALRGMLLAVPDEIERRAGGAAAGLDPAALARARAIARAIAPPPEPPAALRDPAFLGAIHDHAARTVARALGPSILRRAFPPTPVPRGIEALPALERPELASWMRSGLPRLPRPVTSFDAGRAARARRARVRRTVLAAAAAIFVSAGGFVLSWGTSSPPEPVFEVAATPLSSDHPSDFLRGLVDRQVR